MIATQRRTVWKNQLMMETLVRQLFPSHLVLTNTRSFLDGLELDCFIPDLKLAFEYDGRQHFEHVPVCHRDDNSFEELRRRDREKDVLCRERGITLIRMRQVEPLNQEVLKAKLAAAGFWN